MLRIVNCFYSKGDEGKKYLVQFFADSLYWKDHSQWKNLYKLVYKLKRDQLNQAKKPGSKTGGFMNPLRVLHGIQSIIVKKDPEEESNTEEALKNDSLELIEYYLANLSLDLQKASEILRELGSE